VRKRDAVKLLLLLLGLSSSLEKSKKYTLTLLWLMFYHLAPLPPPPLPVCGNKFTTNERRQKGWSERVATVAAILGEGKR